MEFFVRRPWIFGVVGLALSVAMVPMFLWAREEAARFADGPSSMEVAEAARLAEQGDEIWVTLTDVDWRCNETLQDGKVVVLATGEGRRFVVELRRDETCSGVSQGAVVGVLSTLAGARRNYLINTEGLTLTPADEPALILCTYCGGDNAKIGLFMAPLMFVLGLSLYPLLRKMRADYYGY